MARPATEGQPATEPEQNLRRESYIAGEPDSAPELVRLMKCKTETDVIAISTQDILIAATQASQTIVGWEVTILTYEEQLSELRLRLADLETQTQDLQNQNNEQKGVIRYLEQNRTA